MVHTLNDAAAWLLQHGGAIIRYRTARELLHETPDPGELLASPLVQRWLGNLGYYGLDSNSSHGVHGGWNTSFETALGKLVQLGLHAGLRPLDQRVAPWSDALGQHPGRFHYHRMMVASLLGWAGYGAEPPVRSVLETRLERLAHTALTVGYNIYDDRPPDGHPSHRWIDPALYPDGDIRLPWIHDLYGLTTLQGERREQVDTVVNWVMAPDGQQFPHVRYGVVNRNGRGIWIGWRPVLPGYFDMEWADLRALVMRLDLFARFETARTHPWFLAGLGYLERYRTDRGTYRFPAAYLPDEPTRGYWVQGVRMGLGENRRRQGALEVESTFWMARIKQSAGSPWSLQP